jgi:hypothetical protein
LDFPYSAIAVKSFAPLIVPHMLITNMSNSLCSILCAALGLASCQNVSQLMRLG